MMRTIQKLFLEFNKKRFEKIDNKMRLIEKQNLML